MDVAFVKSIFNSSPFPPVLTHCVRVLFCFSAPPSRPPTLPLWMTAWSTACMASSSTWTCTAAGLPTCAARFTISLPRKVTLIECLFQHETKRLERTGDQFSSPIKSPAHWSLLGAPAPRRPCRPRTREIPRPELTPPPPRLSRGHVLRSPLPLTLAFLFCPSRPLPSLFPSFPKECGESGNRIRVQASRVCRHQES